MANKRISRSRKRELGEPDEFITFSNKLLKLVGENRRKIVSTAGIVIALIVVFSGIRLYSVQTEKKAFAMLENGMKKYEKSLGSDDPVKVYLDVKTDFQFILDEYPRMKAGKIARMVFANICYAAGEYDVAIDMYHQSLEDFEERPFYRYLVLNSLAYAYEQKKDYAHAVNYMEMINSGPDLEMKDDVFFTLGRLYSANNDTDKKMEFFKKIIDEYPDSIYTDIVKEKIGDARFP